MSDPATREEYEAKFQANSRLEGSGFDVRIVSPCPFCAAPDFMAWRVLDIEPVVSKGATCRECGRGCRGIVKHPFGGTTIEFVQTGGPDGASWLPPMRRATVESTIPAPPPSVPPPTDWSARTTTKGGDPNAPRTIDPQTGQQDDYVILSEEERARGFVRPVRRSYVHAKCGVTTTMSLPLAETYAREPGFYSATFCTHCRTHFPVGAAGEFVWSGTEEKVGT